MILTRPCNSCSALSLPLLGWPARNGWLVRYPVVGMENIRAAYDELYVYTMGRPGFILQHVVDAFGVQTATADTKPITIVFGLVGLYLHVEKQFSGKQVQKAHMELGRRKREWPNLQLPDDRGSMTATDVAVSENSRRRAGACYKRPLQEGTGRLPAPHSGLRPVPHAAICARGALSRVPRLL